MAKQTKTEHTGFRNGDLFCFHCGDSHSLGLPLAIDELTEKVKTFAQRHESCPKTWVEPKPESADTKSELENEDWWATKGEHGVSSKTMFNALCHGRKLENRSGNMTPSDPDDFRRCYLLIKAIPQWGTRLYLLESLSPTWKNIIENWDKLCEMLEDLMNKKKDNGMYKFMKSLGC